MTSEQGTDSSVRVSYIEVLGYVAVDIGRSPSDSHLEVTTARLCGLMQTERRKFLRCL